LIRLSEIGKEHWISEFKYSEKDEIFYFSKVLAKEIWQIIKSRADKNFFWLNNMTLKFDS